MENDEWIPVMTTTTTLSQAPETIIQLVKLVKSRCAIKGTMIDESLSVPPSRAAMHGPLAAVPKMMMNVRINKANVTMMTAILRMERMMMMMMMMMMMC